MKQKYFKVERNWGACLVEDLVATPEGIEPVFVIRASDEFAPEAIRAYLGLVERINYPDAGRRGLVTLANDFQMWAATHGRHQPDGNVKSKQLSVNEPLEIKMISSTGKQIAVKLNEGVEKVPKTIPAPQPPAPTAPAHVEPEPMPVALSEEGAAEMSAAAHVGGAASIQAQAAELGMIGEGADTKVPAVPVAQAPAATVPKKNK